MKRILSVVILCALSACSWTHFHQRIRSNVASGRGEWTLQGPASIDAKNPATLIVEISPELRRGSARVLVFEDETSTVPGIVFGAAGAGGEGRMRTEGVTSARGRLVIEPTDDALGFVEVEVEYR